MSTSIEYPRPVRRTVTWLMLAAFLGLLGASLNGRPADPHDHAPAADQTMAAQQTGMSPADLPPQVAEQVSALMAKLKDAPADANILLDLGALFLENNQMAQAERFLSRAVSTAPDNQEARLMLGQYLYMADDINGAALQFETILQKQRYTPAMINLGILYKYHLNKKAEAKKLFEDVLATPEAERSFAEKAKEELQGM